MKKTITFLTDFGLKSNYPAQMKAVALSITNAQIIDITHNVTPQNISEGAFLLKTSINYFPIGTTHVAVVDPGVGGNRKGIVIVTPRQVFVGPDNGLMIPAAETQGKYQVFEIKNKNLMLENISNTFHGRDVFTPVASHILNGVEFNEIGPKKDNYVKLNLEDTTTDEKFLIGKILHIDSFGNVITNISKKELQKNLLFQDKLDIFLGRKKHRLNFVKSYDYVTKNELLSTIGSSNYLEISINQGNAAEKLNAKPGEKIKINID